MSGRRSVRFATERPPPAAIAETSLPCPVLRNSPAIEVAPTTWVLSGIPGRSPVQSVAPPTFQPQGQIVDDDFERPSAESAGQTK